MAEWSSTKVPRPNNGDRAVSSTKGVGKIGYLQMKEWNMNLNFYHIEKITQGWLQS